MVLLSVTDYFFPIVVALLFIFFNQVPVSRAMGGCHVHSELLPCKLIVVFQIKKKQSIKRFGQRFKAIIFI
jgi:hypothetical protein